MPAINIFREVWHRCSSLKSLHAFITARVTQVVNTDELLRAEWVSYVSALDLYVHELVIERMLEIYSGNRPPSAGYQKFALSFDVIERMKRAATTMQAADVFELELRTKFSYLSFQDPEKIAEAIRLFSDIQLWNSIADHNGCTPAQRETQAKQLKMKLSLIVQRRNKIAHEGDMQPTVPRTPWFIDRPQVDEVATFIELVVNSIEAVAK